MNRKFDWISIISVVLTVIFVTGTIANRMRPSVSAADRTPTPSKIDAQCTADVVDEFQSLRIQQEQQIASRPSHHGRHNHRFLGD